MASSRNNKTSGLRILWIPGKRKGHPKGRYDSTNKSVPYSSSHQPKKNEVWSLGGSKSHKNLLEDHPETPLFEGPSSSSSILTPLTCTVAAGGIASSKCIPTDDLIADKSTTLPTTPTTTNSSGTSTPSTALLTSAPVSPDPTATAVIPPDLQPVTVTIDTPVSSDNNSTMPSAKHTVPVVTTTTAEIIKENRFSILSKTNGSPAAVDNIYLTNLPSSPKHHQNSSNTVTNGDGVLNTSFETTTTTSTTTPSTSPHSDTKSTNGHSPTKKNSKRNHNNNHQEHSPSRRSKSKERRGKHKKANKSKELNSSEVPLLLASSDEKNKNSEDVNSIQSLNDKTHQDLDWIDDLSGDYASKLQTLEKQSPDTKLKKKRQLGNAKDLDQLDGVTTAHKVYLKPTLEDRDKKMFPSDKEKLEKEEEQPKEDKLVTCLYYAMMCCECTIS